jgi:hypothetical protein
MLLGEMESRELKDETFYQDIKKVSLVILGIITLLVSPISYGLGILINLFLNNFCIQCLDYGNYWLYCGLSIIVYIIIFIVISLFLLFILILKFCYTTSQNCCHSKTHIGLYVAPHDSYN